VIAEIEQRIGLISGAAGNRCGRLAGRSRDGLVTKVRIKAKLT
jgi:hypothetical protein